MIVNETGLLDDYGNDLDGYVWGRSEDGKRALVVLFSERDPEGVAYVSHINGKLLVGLRWECSVSHLYDYAEVYERRYTRQ